MSCKHFIDLIDDFVEGELDELTAGRVDAHVFACSECRERYEAIKREKNIYARYLFDVEPPNDLWANFQTRLETEKRKNSHFARRPVNVSARKTNIFRFWRFSPLLAGAALMIVFGIGFGWLKFASDEADEDIYVAKTEPNGLKLPPTSDEVKPIKTANSPVQINRGEKKTAAPQNNISNGKYKSLKTGSASVADVKLPFAKAMKIERKTVSANDEGKNAAMEKRSDEETRQQRLQMKNLENEIDGQIERVELLLRSFRNARASETIETFDVAYEKGQARKLLEVNGRLRRDAESYGILDAEELLNRVEPYLLDIANLADRPAPDQVLEIRERVKNQSIIASLQIY